jgi:hypothetical protein
MQTKTFRLFISSTFSDFNEERRLLQTYVFPEIRSYCSDLGGYTFQPIDLRWGVSNEAQFDQKAMEICIDEVHASKLQPYPNFLIMAGDRYGWVPLTYAIERNEFEEILRHVNSDFLDFVNQWYKLDENQIPSSYILQARSGECKEYENWEKVENQLRDVIQAAVNSSELSSEKKLAYFDSATEQETVDGILGYKGLTKFQKDNLSGDSSRKQQFDKANVYAYIRTINEEGSDDAAISSFIIDEADKINANIFKDKIKKSIAESNVFEIEANIKEFSIVKSKDLIPKDRTRGLNYEYEGIGSKTILDSEEGSLFVKKLISLLERSVYDFHGLYIKQNSTELEEQKELQRLFKNDKAEGFVGRESDLAAIQSYISGDKGKFNPNQPLVIYGPSGMGKSALIAKAVEQTECAHKNVIYRFVGSVSGLSNSVDVIKSIIYDFNPDVDSKELELRTVKDEQGVESQEVLQEYFYRLRRYFDRIKKDTIIFIDAVDQFSNKDLLINDVEFSWLPKALPANLKIVISALEDSKYQEDTEYLGLLRRRMPDQNNLHKLSLFNEGQARDMVFGILGSRSRKISLDQQDYLFSQPDSKQPLYLTVAAQELAHWKSFDVTKGYKEAVEGNDLAPTQREIIDEYIENLSTFYHHDKKLVQRVISYIHLARGLSESELLEIISTDNEFIEYIASDTFHTKNENVLPVAIWARLRSHIKPFLKTEYKDGQDTVSFFHREFDEAARDLDGSKQTQEDLIKLILELMYKNQKQKFDSNRYGSLYIELIAEHYRRYKDEEYLKQCGVDITRIDNEKYLNSTINSVYEIASEKRIKMQCPDAIIYQTISLSLSEELYRKNPDVWVSDYVESINHLAACYKATNQVEEAVDLYNMSLEMLRSLYRESPGDWAGHYTVTLSSLAFVYSGVNNWVEKAINIVKEVLDIVEPLYQESPDVWSEVYVSNLITITISYRNNNQISQAIDIGEDLLKVAEVLYEKDSEAWVDNYTEALTSLSLSYSKTASIEKAISLSQEALTIKEPLYQKNPSVWADSYIIGLTNMALYYMDNDQLDQSIDLGKKTLLVVEPLYEETPEVWAGPFTKTISNIALSYKKNGQIEEAIQFGKKALAIRGSLHEENPDVWVEDYLTSIGNLSMAYSAGGQKGLAIVLGKDALDIVRPLHEEAPSAWIEDYSGIVGMLSSMYIVDEQYEEAIAISDELAGKIRPLYEENPEVWGDSHMANLFNLSTYYYRANKIQKAVDAAEEVKKVLEYFFHLYNKDNLDIWNDRYDPQYDRVQDFLRHCYGILHPDAEVF